MATFAEDSTPSLADENVLFAGQGYPNGTTTLTITEMPSNGKIYLHIGGSLTQITAFTLPYSVNIGQFVDVSVTFEPNPNFAGSAGTLNGFFDNSFLSGVDTSFSETAFVQGIIDDDPTDITLLTQSFGSDIPEDASGGFFFSESEIQSPDQLEQWFVQLAGADPDVQYASGHFPKDFLTFSIVDTNSKFEIVRLDGSDPVSVLDDLFFLTLKAGETVDFETEPTISVTLRAKDFLRDFKWRGHCRF